MGIQKIVLIVEDEDDIREMLATVLRHSGFEPIPAADAHEALLAIGDRRPDIVLLDWMLPGMNGIELARRLKRDEVTRDIPIIMLTARGEEADKVRGLESGADDYVTKPFSTRELTARIQAVLRRAGGTSGEDKLAHGGLVLDPVSHRVMAGDQAVEIGSTDYRLLHFFMSHPERVYSRGQLLDQVWGGNVYLEERTVDVHIRRLRMALEPSGHDTLIQTVRGAGYRFSTRRQD